MVFDSVAEFEKYVLDRCQKAVIETEEKVHKVIDSCLRQFYNEFTPAEYIRTNQLLHSLVRTGVKNTGNGFEAEVYFDAGRMNYDVGYVLLQSGNYGIATWDSGKVLDSAMHGSHGGYRKGTAIWDESRALLGDITALLLKELKAAGIPIK